MKINIIFFFIVLSFGLNSINGKYFIKGKNATTYFEFKTDNTFIEETQIHYCGNIIVQNGKYEIYNDTLKLKYDRYFEGYEDAVKAQFARITNEISTNKDSIVLSMNFIENDTTFGFKMPIVDKIEIKIDDRTYNHNFSLDTIQLKVKKSSKISISSKANTSVPVELTIDGNKDYYIEFGLDRSIHDINIEEIKKFLIVKNNSKHLILKAILEDRNSKRFKLSKQ